MFRSLGTRIMHLVAALLLAAATSASGADDWPQFKYDARHSGSAPDGSVAPPLGLVAAAALTDAIFTSPVVSAGRVFVVDGSGVVFCLDAHTLDVIWKHATTARPCLARCPAVPGDARKTVETASTPAAPQVLRHIAPSPSTRTG